MSDTTEEKEYTIEELLEMIPVYKETSSGLTSAMQLVDETNEVNLIPDSSDASDVVYE